MGHIKADLSLKGVSRKWGPSLCGIVQYNSDKKLTPEQIADLTDEELCKKVNFQMVIGDYVPVKYMREAQKKNLEYCADK